MRKASKTTEIDVMSKNSEISKEDIVEEVEKLLSKVVIGSKDIDPNLIELINEHFWDLIGSQKEEDGK